MKFLHALSARLLLVSILVLGVFGLMALVLMMVNKFKRNSLEYLVEYLKAIAPFSLCLAALVILAPGSLNESGLGLGFSDFTVVVMLSLVILCVCLFFFVEKGARSEEYTEELTESEDTSTWD